MNLAEIISLLLAILLFLAIVLYVITPRHRPHPHPHPHPSHHLVGGCAGTRCGCCHNGHTAKANRRVTNCPKF